MNGRSTAAIMAMSASTPTISSNVKPRSEVLLIFGAGQVFDRNVGRKPAATLLTIRSVGHDVIRSAFSRRAIHIRVAPGIVGHTATFEIWPIPGSDARGALYQGGEAFRSRGVAAGIEIEQVERA